MYRKQPLKKELDFKYSYEKYVCLADWENERAKIQNSYFVFGTHQEIVSYFDVTKYIFQIDLILYVLKLLEKEGYNPESSYPDDKGKLASALMQWENYKKIEFSNIKGEVKTANVELNKLKGTYNLRKGKINAELKSVLLYAIADRYIKVFHLYLNEILRIKHLKKMIEKNTFSVKDFFDLVEYFFDNAKKYLDNAVNYLTRSIEFTSDEVKKIHILKWLIS